MVNGVWRSALAAILCLTAGCGNDSIGVAGGHAERLRPVVLPNIEQTSQPREFAPTGRIYVVNVWASWCEPCRQEMASLEALGRRDEAGAVRVVGINVDEDRNLALEYLRAHSLSFEQYWDPGMRATAKAWGLAGVPATLVIGPDGRIRARVSGSRDWDSEPMRRLIFSLVQLPA